MKLLDKQNLILNEQKSRNEIINQMDSNYRIKFIGYENYILISKFQAGDLQIC